MRRGVPPTPRYKLCRDNQHPTMNIDWKWFISPHIQIQILRKFKKVLGGHKEEASFEFFQSEMFQKCDLRVLVKAALLFIEEKN
jgi:hypothetical protein